MYKGNRIVGQYKQGGKNCSFGYGSRGHNSTNCTILIADRPFHWLPANFGVIPPTAVVGGHTANLEVMFVCKGMYNGEQVVGKIRPTFSGCDIAPAGRIQVRIQHYEVLVHR